MKLKSVLFLILLLVGCVDNLDYYSTNSKACPILHLGNTVATTTIDVMMLYTPAAVAHPNVELAQAVAATNQFYTNSEVPLKFNLVHHQQYNAAYNVAESFDVSLNNLETQLQTPSSASATARNTYKADVVILVRDITPPTGSSTFTCGRASMLYSHNISQPSPSPSANNLKLQGSFTVITLNPVCGSTTTAHELGHILGLLHGNPDDDPNKIGKYVYSKGYAEQYKFGTIMVYGFLWGVKKDCQLPIFSNPNIQGCDPILGCGVPDQMVAARSIPHTMNDIASIYP